MSAYYSWFSKSVETKLYADKESGLNILVKEVLFEDFFSKVENQKKSKGVN
jgi:hypothetical protein